MNILMVTSECFPYAKTGGMGEVVFSLSQYLQKLGNQISIVLPYYSSVEHYLVKSNISVEILFVDVQLSKYEKENIKVFYWTSETGCTFFAIKHNLFFKRKDLYGDVRGDYSDNSKRFSFFCRSVLHLLQILPQKFNVIHCHDWQTALIPVFLKLESQFSDICQKNRTLLTIHNLAYQGIFSINDLSFISNCPSVRKALMFYENINFLKAGLLFADVLNTVSSQYAQEVQTVHFGEGLSKLFYLRRNNFFGILNGIDNDYWNPQKKDSKTISFDKHLLQNKEENKRQLFKRFHWKNPEKYLFMGMLSRIVSYKGFDLLIEAIHDIMGLDIAVIVLGMGDIEIERSLSLISQRYSRFKAYFNYTDQFAHQIYSSIDAFLMPSCFEPCGLTQMIAMRYGAIPLVHSTGGLKDTVGTMDSKGMSGKGFIMEHYSSVEMLIQIRKMCDVYRQKKYWKSIMTDNMSCDFSWNLSAKKYLVLYHHVDRI